MDILAHMLWTNAGGKGIAQKIQIETETRSKKGLVAT
jgi:hypothetical protein